MSGVNTVAPDPRQVLTALFEMWQHRLGLDHWHIDVRVEQPRESRCFFEVRRSASYNRAIVVVPPWLVYGGDMPEGMLDVTITDDFIEAGIVHELLHLTRRQTEDIVYKRLDGQLHRDVYTVVIDSYDSAQELEIENLAVALVKAWRRS